MSQPLTVAQFKTNFAREFLFGALKTQIMDTDVTRALNEAEMLYNDSLWSSTTEKQVAYGYIAAHYLALNFQSIGGSSTSGNGTKVSGRGPVQSKSVGQVSLTYQLPQGIVDSPILSGLLVTDFGRRYLQLLAPRITGYMFTAGEVGVSKIDELPVVPPQILPTGNFNVIGGLTPVLYFFLTMDTSELAARFLIGRDGTIQGFRMNAATNTLNGQAAFRFYLNGIASTINATLAPGVVATVDNVNSIAVVAGDEIDIQVDVSTCTQGQLSSLRASVMFV